MKFSIDAIKKEVGAKTEDTPKPLQADVDVQYIKTGTWLRDQGLMPPSRLIADSLVKFLVETKLHYRKKGLFFIGGVGTGKTVAFKIIQSVREFEFLESYEITEISKGFKTSSEYIKILFIKFVRDKNKNVIIDDLGDELTINSYGIKSEFMTEVIRERHKTFIDRGDLTLISSNLNEEAFKARYGERIYSRITQMCEVVVCNGKDLRCK